MISMVLTSILQKQILRIRMVKDAGAQGACPWPWCFSETLLSALHSILVAATDSPQSPSLENHPQLTGATSSMKWSNLRVRGEQFPTSNWSRRGRKGQPLCLQERYLMPIWQTILVKESEINKFLQTFHYIPISRKQKVKLISQNVMDTKNSH